MKSFSQLLNGHIERLGISDSELARAVGVSRQTIFRWREGVTSRPRHREDVLAVSDKLRLAPEERDTLLLAAGFHPQEPASESAESEGLPPGEPKPAKEEEPAAGPHEIEGERKSGAATARPHSRLSWGRLVLGLGSGLVLVVLILWWISRPQSPEPTKGAAGSTAEPGTTTQPEAPPTRTATILPAAPGEELVMVSHFADSPGGRFARSLVDALEREVSANRLSGIRVAVWPEAVHEAEVALKLAQEADASLLVFGSQDADHIVVQFTRLADPSLPAAQGSPGQTSGAGWTTVLVEGDRPLQVRSLALLVLGEVSIGQNDLEQALPLLAQACNALRDDGGAGEQFWSLINGLLCHGYALEGEADQALPYCQLAIESSPRAAFLASRGLAYAIRGDASSASADLRQVVNWLQRQPPEAWRHQLVRYETWVDMLEGGQDPFESSVLAELRAEFARSGIVMCNAICTEQDP